MSVVRFLATLVFAWIAIRATFANTATLRHPTLFVARATTTQRIARHTTALRARTVAQGKGRSEAAGASGASAARSGEPASTS